MPLLSIILPIKIRVMLKQLYSINIRKLSIIIVICILLSISCKKDEVTDVPSLPSFSIELEMNSDLANLGAGQIATIIPNKLHPEYSVLDFHTTAIQNKQIAFQCYGNGIVLCKGADNEYKAYDLTCTYNAFTDYCAVTLKNNDIFENCIIFYIYNLLDSGDYHHRQFFGL